MNGLSNRIVRTIHVARVVLFLIGITIPLIGFCFAWQGSSRLNSKGEPVAVPVLGTDPYEWGEFVLAFRTYFNERFGFREPLIQLQARINIRGFGVAANDKVVPGKDGWLFMGKSQDAIEYSRHLRPFTPDEMVVWKEVLEKRRNYLRAKGIEYVFVIAPNKEAIYPEFLPDWYNRVHSQSRLDQLREYLTIHSDVKVVDLRPALLAAKGDVPLFYKTDSHWNPLGACVAYQTLMNEIRESFPMIRPYSLTDFTIERQPNEIQGDLLDLCGLGDQMREDDIIVCPRHSRRARSGTLREPETEGRDHEPTFVTECDSTNLPKAVVFRDSFFTSLQPFVSEHFQRAVFVWQPYFDARYVDRESCDIVIQEMVERTLVWWPPPADRFEEN